MGADTMQHVMETSTNSSSLSFATASQVETSSSGTAHSSGADTVCPEPLVPLTNHKSANPVVLNYRSRDLRSHQPHGVAELDLRSEASSEHTRGNKFKVVKLESKAPYFRGRWQCFDFHDRPKDSGKAGNNASNTERGSSTEQSSTSTTIGLITSRTGSIAESESPSVGGKIGKFKVTAVPVNLSPLNPAPVSNVDAMLPPTSVVQSATLRQVHDSSSSSTVTVGTVHSGAVSRKQSVQVDRPVHLTDSHAALSAELKRRTTIDAGADGSDAAGLSLDNKIRQCMDLVGHHLIIAVTSELEQVSGEHAKLREKVEQLEFENNALRSENAILRSAAVTAAAASHQPADVISRNQPSRKK